MPLILSAQAEQEVRGRREPAEPVLALALVRPMPSLSAMTERGAIASGEVLPAEVVM